MEQSVVIRHVTGTKGSAVEEIPIAGHTELLAGRAPSCDIRYDLDADSLVSRRHMKIEIDGAAERKFTAVDLNSRNGTFINRKRIRNPSRLAPGDVIQLGAGGPEFVFDVDPQSAEASAAAAKTTGYNILSELESPAREPAQPLTPSKPSKSLVIAAVLVLLVATAAVCESRWPVLRGVESRWVPMTQHAAVITLAGLQRSVGSYFDTVRGFFKRVKPRKESSRKNMNGGPLPANTTVNADSLASVQASWMLLDARSGRQLRQVYIENRGAGDKAGTLPLVPNAGRSLPLFVLLDGNRLQPVLTLSEESSYQPIGGVYRNPGFVASAGGLILTSRRVATPWSVPYDWPADTTAGVVAKFDRRLKLVNTAVLARRQFPQWVPLAAEFILADSLDAPALKLSTKEVRLSGRMDSLTVNLHRQSGPTPARVDSTSEQLDVAAIRVAPGVLLVPAPKAIQPRLDSDCLPGDTAVILRPGSRSPAANEAEPAAEWSGKVVALRHEVASRNNGPREQAEQYELLGQTHSTHTPGMPVFDAQGRVFAIESAGDPLRPASVFAVPIRYGLQLLATAAN